MKIAIVKLSALGDIVHSMVVLQYIKQVYPHSYIEWIVEKRFEQVLANNKHIDKITTIELKEIKKQKSLKLLFAQINQIKSLGTFDIVIDMQGLIKSALITKLIKATDKWGFDKNSIREKFASMFYNKQVDIEYSQNVIKRNIYLVSNALNLDLDIDTLEYKEPFLYSSTTFSQYKEFVIFVVGASNNNKMYPKESFATLATMIDKPIYAIWASKEEEDIADYLVANSKVQKAPKMSLDELKAYIKQSILVIGGDTGPTHMAWGLNVPSITIFGNTPEYRNALTTKINKTIKSSSKVNPLKIDKNDFSINEINPQDIYDIAKELL